MPNPSGEEVVLAARAYVEQLHYVFSMSPCRTRLVSDVDRSMLRSDKVAGMLLAVHTIPWPYLFLQSSSFSTVSLHLLPLSRDLVPTPNATQ
jgi:hypothetical protein